MAKLRALLFAAVGLLSAAAGAHHPVAMDKRPAAPNINARKFAKGMLRLVLAAASGGIKDAPCRRRIFRKLSWRSDRTRRKIAAAVGAHSVKTVLDAIAAEGALERADHRVGGRWRQVDVAAFATWTKFEHSDVFRSGDFVTSFLSRYGTECNVMHFLRFGSRKPRSVPVET